MLTDTVFPTVPFTILSIYAKGADLQMLQGQAWALESIWDEAAGAP